jgi:MerR family transcriptional regulator/heat shock protein HspR
LRYVQHLSQEEGVNLAGIRHVLELQSQVEDLRHRVNQLLAEVQRGVSQQSTQRVSRVFSAGPEGDVIAMGRQQTTTRWIRTQPLELGPR